MSERKKLRALVVEDQEMFRLAVADELSFLGFDVSVAENGEEGFKAACSSSFDLIFSDIRMPVKDGQWLLEEFRKVFTQHPPLVFMTGFADLAPSVAFALGADGFLAKPLNQEKLERLVKKLCPITTRRWEQDLNEIPKITISLTCSSAEDAGEVILGRGGMFVKLVEDSYKLGDVVAFDIKFKSGSLRHIEGSGSIVWKRPAPEGDLPAGVGIDFDYFNEATIQQWFDFLAAHEFVSTIPRG